MNIGVSLDLICIEERGAERNSAGPHTEEVKVNHRLELTV